VGEKYFSGKYGFPEFPDVSHASPTKRPLTPSRTHGVASEGFLDGREIFPWVVCPQAAHYGHLDAYKELVGLQPHEFLLHIGTPVVGCLGLMGGLNPGLNPQLPRDSRVPRQPGDYWGFLGIFWAPRAAFLQPHEFCWILRIRPRRHKSRLKPPPGEDA